MNLTKFRSVLNADGWPRLIFLARNCHRPEASIRLFLCLPWLPCSTLDRAVHGALISSGIRAVVTALDDRSNARLPWFPWCASLRLYGFEEPRNSTPYHYWFDGSTHDGRTATDWYRRNPSDGVLIHNFRREHAFMRGELGGNASSFGPFTIRRRAVRRACGTDADDSDAELRASATTANGRHTVRRVGSAKRRNATDVRMEQRRHSFSMRLLGRAMRRPLRPISGNKSRRDGTADASH